MQDVIKEKYDAFLKQWVEELKILEQQARAVAMIVDNCDSIAVRLQADMIENLWVAMQNILDSGGLPSLDKIDEMMYSFPILRFSTYNLPDSTIDKLKAWNNCMGRREAGGNARRR